MAAEQAGGPLDGLSPAAKALVERRLRGAAGSGRIPRRPGAGPAPLSSAQQRLWFFHQLFGDSLAYNVPYAYRLRGPLDVPCLERALDEVVRRHEVLRSTFETGPDGVPAQVVNSAEPVALPVTSLEGRAPARRPAVARRLARQRSRQPFDLRTGPLLRADLFRLDGADHVLLLCFHHVVGDLWSLGLLCSELSALYAAFLRGAASPLPEPAIQYADFAVWQREHLSGPRLERDLAYWRAQLAGLPALALPTDRPHPATQSFEGAHLRVHVPVALVARLRELGQRRGATLFTTLLAALSAVLHRHTGQDDVAVGCALAGRSRPELEGLIGFFVNTLVLRTDCSGDPTFSELLARVVDHALAAQEHQDLPFERLVEEVSPGRDLSRAPLVQVGLSYLNAPADPPRLPGLAVSPFDVDPGIVKLDLDLAMCEVGGGVTVDVDYRSDLFERATVGRLLDHLVRLLAAVVEDPDRRISAVPLSSPEERERRARFNATAVATPRDRLVHELVADRALDAPGAPAVLSGDRTLTFAELDERAERLAGALRRLGVGPDVVVAVFLERSADLVVALLAVLRAGGAYVPLDPSYPVRRLAFLLRDSRARVLVTTSVLGDRLPAPAGGVIHVDGDLPQAAPPVDRPVAANLAYLIYTSGSTGTPKAVGVEHRGLLNLCHWHRTRYRTTAADRGTFVAAQGFDVSVYELWPYLAAGASVAIADEDIRTDPGLLAGWLGAQGATLASLTTPLAEAVLGGPDAARLRVRAVLTGGDVLRHRPPPGLPFELVNHYGPTEATVVATSATVADAEAASAAGPVPIGEPIANVQVHVLDERLREVPPGARGELHIGGDGVARGYVGQPGRTAERFLPDPFGPPGRRLYRTGDLGRWRPDGTIEFLGRADRQAKIRGFRVEPGEVERQLGEHPGVRDVAVEPRDQRLVAYVVTEEDPAALRGWLRARLPEALVPAAYVRLPRLPLNANGKVDRLALPPPDDPGPGTAAPARNDVERMLAATWSDVLGRQEIGVDDDFFALGGHSLLAARVAARVRQHFDVDVSLRAMFEAPTVARFAAEVLGPRLEERDREVTRRLAALPEERTREVLAALLADEQEEP